MSGEDGVTQVPNPYLAALRRRRTESLPHVHDLRTALDEAIRHMDEGAWFSTAADEFYAALTQRRSTLLTVRDNAVGEFDQAISGMPEMVDSTSWYVRWRNLG